MQFLHKRYTRGTEEYFDRKSKKENLKPLSIRVKPHTKEFYKKHDFDILYEECQNDRIPFNLYEEWIMNKFKINDNNAINSIINDCFICSSII